MNQIPARHVISISQIQTMNGQPNWKGIGRLRKLQDQGCHLTLTSHFGESHAFDVARQLDIAHLFTWR